MRIRISFSVDQADLYSSGEDAGKESTLVMSSNDMHNGLSGVLIATISHMPKPPVFSLYHCLLFWTWKVSQI